MKIFKTTLKTLILGVAVMVIGLHVNTKEVSASYGETCAPIEIEICSICGNNYNDGNICSHHKGEMYNGDICSPDSGSLCNVCNSDYSHCSHVVGNTYGGTVCSVWRQCDICGNDYDDGSVCSHHEGTWYGGEECTTYVVTICNICGNDYNDADSCAHHTGGYYYDYDDVCEPYDIDRCSICGNNYNDADVCSHHVGEVYGGTICTTTRICNICGNNYDDGSVCSHHIDERYGGTVCQSYSGTICNICGNDYNDGYWCPHYVGEMYNGTICTTTIKRVCNICGNDYDNGNLCSHHEGTYYSMEARVASAKDIIARNRDNIKDAARCYNVDPAIIAACIYTEQCNNVNIYDDFDVMGSIMLGMDTSIGIGQVLYSTAEHIEDYGYFNNSIANSWELVTIKNDSKTERGARLLDERTNIFYVGGYLRFFIDLWYPEFPTIAKRPDILATLYNRGEFKTTPNSNPNPNPFGEFAQENYELMNYLLAIY